MRNHSRKSARFPAGSALFSAALGLVTTAAGAVLFAPSPALSADHARTVLVLHSYHRADWTDSIMEGIESVFGKKPGIELRVEYMDTKTLNTPEYLDQLAEIYQSKYGEVRFDLILTSDDNALLFALDHQALLFKGTPVVFCGVNRYKPGMLKNNPDVTGVVEKGDFRESLESVRSLLPGIGNLAVICDKTRTGLLNLAVFEKVMNEHFPGLRYRLLQDVSFGELTSALRNPGKAEAAFFISFWTDSEGAPVGPADLEAAFRASSIPVFGRSEWMLNRGMAGGKVVHGYSQGREAALLGERILDGTPARSLAVVTDSPNKFIFDYLELERHGLDEKNVPEGSLLINRPSPFYAVDKRVGAALLFSLALATAFSILLATVNARRKSSETLLRASEERYRSLVDNIELGITLVDDRYRVVMTNAAQGRLLKRPAREFVGKYCFEEFEKRESVCPHCPGARAMKSGAASIAETEGVRGDGSRIHVRIHAFPLKGRDGRAAGFIEVVEDITERNKRDEDLRSAYERLKEQNIELKKLDRIKDALISDISHELKTPVAKHQMYLEVLKSAVHAGTPPEKVEDVFRVLEEGVRRQHQVIRNILVLSHLEEGKRELDIESVRLDMLVQEIVDDYRSAGDRLGITMEVLPAAVEINTDREMMLHVIANLVENSIKYHAADSPRISVAVSADADRAVVTVRDNGIGMTEEERSRAFDRFYQSTVSKEGIGLGLNICRKILDRLGGEIVLASGGRGRGTEVTVTMRRDIG